ncbi:ADP-ribosylglycohydrolase family protein [Orrella sp. NBD-18]|uniref:ADP-ribosylglycohydrolase family protein n=1 Tax=Sheuella amnicola TaxID=2707330 RepID=A0A6B2R069_9BURK|nr:ADP-ribosylglycohydrolase family protein [Sheuella amnicola]NDY83701.1 ADP-ribosylglycohydrolase family protein [Sheuella amnicola]
MENFPELHFTPKTLARFGLPNIAYLVPALNLKSTLLENEKLSLAVNHDGDSDSTAAIVCNLLGAMHGMKAIYAEWLNPLELRDVITELAEDLYAFKEWRIGEYSDNKKLNQRI